MQCGTCRGIRTTEEGTVPLRRVPRGIGRYLSGARPCARRFLLPPLSRGYAEAADAATRVEAVANGAHRRDLLVEWRAEPGVPTFP